MAGAKDIQALANGLLFACGEDSLPATSDDGPSELPRASVVDGEGSGESPSSRSNSASSSPSPKRQRAADDGCASSLPPHTLPLSAMELTAPSLRTSDSEEELPARTDAGPKPREDVSVGDGGTAGPIAANDEDGSACSVAAAETDQAPDEEPPASQPRDFLAEDIYFFAPDE